MIGVHSFRPMPQKPKLPDVTLVMLDCTCPELARLAVLDTLKLVEPEEVLIFSDTNLRVPGTKHVKVRQWVTLEECINFFCYVLPYMIKTKFMLNIQWDGWVIDAEMWDPAFLNYDFIGAPWWHAHNNVGNGTGIRSIELMRFIDKYKDVFPMTVGNEDELLCRIYRPTLEMHGFKWAPEKLASRFSFECTRPSVTSRHFMFHDSFNFPAVLGPDQYARRLALMRDNPYILKGKKLTEIEQGRTALILDRLGD